MLKKEKLISGFKEDIIGNGGKNKIEIIKAIKNVPLRTNAWENVLAWNCSHLHTKGQKILALTRDSFRKMESGYLFYSSTSRSFYNYNKYNFYYDIKQFLHPSYSKHFFT